MICNEYVGLYFYSAIFQGNMALLALLGVFVVFKRQELTNDLQGKDFGIISFIQNYLDWGIVAGKHVPFNYRNVTDLPKIISDMANGIGVPPNVQEISKRLNDDPNFIARFQERATIIENREKVVDLLWFPFYSILFVIILSIVILPFAHFIHLQKTCFELPAIIIVVILNIGALVAMTRYVWKVLKK